MPKDKIKDLEKYRKTIGEYQQPKPKLKFEPRHFNPVMPITIEQPNAVPLAE